MPILTFWQLVRGLMFLNTLTEFRPLFSPLSIDFVRDSNGAFKPSISWDSHFNTTFLSPWGKDLTIWANEGLIAAGESESEPEEDFFVDEGDFICVWRREFLVEGGDEPAQRN